MTDVQTARRAVLAFIGGLSIFRSAGGGAADTFTLVPELTPGQRLRYRQDLQMVRGGVVGHRSRSTVSLEILDRMAGGWLARWTSSNAELLEADPRVRPVLEVLAALWDGVAIDLLLDDAGRVVGLADPAAVQALGTRSLDRLLPVLLPGPTEAGLAQALRRMLQPILADGGALAQSLLKEPTILMGAMGHDYRVGKPLEVRGRVPSPLGSGDLPVLGRYQVRGISVRGARADIGWLMVIDRAAAARTLGAELQGLLRQAPPSIDTAVASEATQSLDFDDRGDFSVDTATAWPLSVRHQRRFSVASVSRVDTVELTRLGG